VFLIFSAGKPALALGPASASASAFELIEYFVGPLPVHRKGLGAVGL